MSRRTLLVCGALSSLLYVLSIDVVAPLLYPDYHAYKAQMVSELFARGAPTRALMLGLSIPYNVLVLMFAVGVWQSAAGKRAIHLTALGLAAYGLTSMSAPLLGSMDLRAAGLTGQTVLHIWATALQGVFMTLVFLFGAFVQGERFRRLSFVALGLCLASGGWAGVQASQDSPWLGITERISIYIWMAWLVALAASLWGAGNRIAESSPSAISTVRSQSVPPGGVA